MSEIFKTDAAAMPVGDMIAALESGYTSLDEYLGKEKKRMKNKKVYSSPEVEVTKFSFENILAGSETDDVDLQRIKQSNPDVIATDGADVEW